MATRNVLSKIATLAGMPQKKAKVAKASKPITTARKSKAPEVSRWAHLAAARVDPNPPVVAQTKKADEAQLIREDLAKFGRIRTAAERKVDAKTKAAFAARLAAAAKAIR